MRKVTGEEITIKELKECTFGYNEENIDFSKMVEFIEFDNDTMFAITEDNNAIIRYPKDPFNNNTFINYCKKDENLSVWDFITDYWGLDEYDLTYFTFYFAE